MAFIEGAEFKIGSDDGQDTPIDETPRRDVAVRSFCLDVTEVTVKDHVACEGCERPHLRELAALLLAQLAVRVSLQEIVITGYVRRRPPLARDAVEGVVVETVKRRQLRLHLLRRVFPARGAAHPQGAEQAAPCVDRRLQPLSTSPPWPSAGAPPVVHPWPLGP